MLLNSGLAQVANPSSTPETSTTTTTATTTTTTTAAAAEAAPIVLSPFEVDSTQDTGYRARNTLAGSRISTNLEDLAGPITVVTKDFMQDIGATNVNDILTYTVGTEGTKDFQSNTPQLGRTSDNVAQDPNAANRGRGLAEFDVTRDYFYSLTEPNNGQSVGFDPYNVDNVTIIRGADSILAGLGSPAGIINYSPEMALLTRNSVDASYRFGSYGDKRATFDYNIVAKENVLAFRIAGVWKDVGYEQQPAYNHDKRYYLAMTYKPFSKTTIHASYENVNILAHYPNTYTPEDDITPWINAGKPVSPAPGVSAPGLSGGGYNSGPNVYYNANGGFFSAYNNSTLYTYYTPFPSPSLVGIYQVPRFANNQYGDWNSLNTNGTRQSNRLTTDEISIDQEIITGLNFNAAFVHEISYNHQLNLGRPDFVADSVDVNEELPWGAPNPHFGDTYMYFAGLDNLNGTYDTNRVGRASLTYDLDLTKYNKWLGRYVFTGFAEQRRTTTDFNDYNASQAGAGATVGGGPGIVSYTGGDAANGYFTSSVAQVPHLFTDVPFTNNMGVTAANFTTIYDLKEEEKSITKLSTSAIVLQAYLLDDIAVGTFGLRRDVDKAGFLSNNAVDPVSELVNPLPNDQFSNGPLTTVQAQTKTYGVVLHGPKIGNIDLKWLSLGYNQSQNFIPNAGSVDLLGNPTPDPTGTTKDKSIAVDLFGGKLNAKIDWFTSIAANADAPTVNFPLVQWSIPFISLVNNNANGIGAYADLARQVGFTSYTSGLAPGITTGDNALANAYTANTQSKGMEFELTYNVNKNWRIYGTLTREQAEQSNIAPALTSFINARVAYWQANGLWNGPTTTKQDWCGCPETGQQVYNADVLAPFIAYQAASGQPSQQLHKWKASMLTNYSFDHGIIKGAGVGAGIRYLDKTIIGNPAIYSLVNGAETVSGLDLANPYTAPAQTNIELWATYSRKVYDNKYLLSFRIEADNIQTSGGYFPVNANSDGQHQLFTIVQPRTYYFTTELKF